MCPRDTCGHSLVRADPPLPIASARGSACHLPGCSEPRSCSLFPRSDQPRWTGLLAGAAGEEGEPHTRGSRRSLPATELVPLKSSGADTGLGSDLEPSRPMFARRFPLLSFQKTSLLIPTTQQDLPAGQGIWVQTHPGQNGGCLQPPSPPAARGPGEAYKLYLV